MGLYARALPEGKALFCVLWFEFKRKRSIATIGLSIGRYKRHAFASPLETETSEVVFLRWFRSVTNRATCIRHASAPLTPHMWTAISFVVVNILQCQYQYH